ncbi:hypothetical protein EWM64_g6863 [Hericium alpestre]|uniref:Alpha-L-rhamnosidase six-hairpin glycosidase domain-containing protein n=1 Tax=Hericium alpestre TaxID=135208 RepID=A0A4Y9ZSD5_9AGAM|nr:hypothetical protein EWM64_g6863 [Hericium alpestre]
MSYDGVLHVPAPLSNGYWIQPAPSLRGGFRFLTIVLNSNDSISISNVSCSISFMPHVDNLRDYSGYFYASNPVFHDKDFLTKICAVWPGDMGVAVPTQFVSTNDLLPTRNALSTLFTAQNPTTGALPESGPPLSQQGSDTYHMWTLIGAYNYYLYSGDTDWLQGVWANYTKAVSFLENEVDSSGLMNITGLRDWARLGGGGHNAEGNALYYKVLTNSAELAGYLNETDVSTGWARNASALKMTYNSTFWVPELGMYRDNTSTTLCPQDANSMAILYNLTTLRSQASSVSKGLTANWNDIGAVAPELPDNISPFIGSLEIAAHFEADNDNAALELIRRQWGYMLYTNLSVQSTLLEGFTANGSLLYRSYQGYNYDPSYTSHSHGWSSGPTSALTFYVLGLTVTSPQGRTWSIAPHISGLSAAEGGFETALGWFGVQWNTSHGSFTLALDVPKETKGVVRLPMGDNVSLDGKPAKAEDDGSLAVQGGPFAMALGSTMGALFVGMVFDAVLYGTMTLQTYRFFHLGILDTFQLVLICHVLYYFLILHYGETDVLQYTVWSLNIEIGISVIITFLVRSFFSVRVWHLSGKNKILAVIILGQFLITDDDKKLMVQTTSQDWASVSGLGKYLIGAKLIFNVPAMSILW